jgi:hypothetical protein
MYRYIYTNEFQPQALVEPAAMEPSMIRTRNSIGVVVIFLLLTFLAAPSQSVFALSAEQAGIPKSLQEWIPWVTYDQETKTCTLRSDNVSKGYCAWPTRLVFEVTDQGASFRQEWFIETKSLVELPGGEKLWPSLVKDSGKDLPVIDQKGSPAVWLERGSHVLTGTYTWTQSPESITIPPGSGLFSLKRNGIAIDTPDLDAQGRLWLKARGEVRTSQMDHASVQVFRKVQDMLPLTEDIDIRLTVSGAPREITLGLQVADDFLPLKITSPLPVRMDQEGRLCVQVRPGQWNLSLTVRNTSPTALEKLAIGKIDGLWPDNEVWVFEAAPDFRQVAVENVQSVDPSQTGLSPAWRNLPAYLMGRGDTMILNEKTRGMVKTTPDSLTLERTLWLDENGGGLTAHDKIRGVMTEGWRLSTLQEQHLGKVSVDGVNQLITRLPDSDQVGVEVRKGNIALAADSRLEQPVTGGILTLSALGWDHSFQHLSARLNLPPGWKLFTATGIDTVSTWLNRWTLLDIFLVLIISIASGKILGWGRGLLSLIAVGLIYHQPGSPQLLWLPFLALLAIGQKVSSEKARLLIRIPLFIILALLLVQSVPFMIREIRTGLFPQLDFSQNFPMANARFAMGGASSPVADLEEPQNEEHAADEFRQEQVQEEAPAPPPSSKLKSLPRQEMAALPHAAPKKAPLQSSNSQLLIDPQAKVQTGPGLPTWRWQTIPLSWNGPVDPSQKIRLVLLSPLVNCLLGFLRVGLLTLLLMIFLQRSLSLLPLAGAGKLFGRSLLLLAALLLSATPQPSAAEVPAADMLHQMQERLLSPPDCKDACASLDTGLLTLQADSLTLDLTVHSYADTAVPVPGDSKTFSQILLDNAPAIAVLADEKGLLIRVPQGIHHIKLVKNIQDVNEFHLTFPLLPHRMQTEQRGWDLTGIHPDGTIEKQLTFIRQEKKDKGAKGPGEEIAGDLKIPAFFEVSRTLHLGLKWTVETHILRKSGGNIIIAEIPLIPGEMPTTESLYIKDNKVQINLGPQDGSFTWQSVLPISEAIRLTAAQTSQWIEAWHLDISSIWHVTTTGIPEVSQLDPAGLRFPQYRPHPGESLSIAVSRPEAAPGPTMTINSSQLHLQPGLRATDCTLHFNLVASQGGRHDITLPADSELQNVLINGAASSLRLNGWTLTIPVHPGSQQISISWQDKGGIAAMLRTPPVDLGLENVNFSLHIDVPSSRWILLTGGPRIGPAVLFWGEFLVIVLLSILLGRTRITPLSTASWLLLGMGLSQVHVALGALVVGWLFLLGIRKKAGASISSATAFNLLQIALAAVTVLAFLALVFTVKQGLLGSPDMQIGGNNSFNHALNWYQDRNGNILPQAWVLTVPLLCYRILMLVWALWLALALLKWLTWGWDCFTTGGPWRKKAPREIDFDIELRDDSAAPEQPDQGDGAQEQQEQDGIEARQAQAADAQSKKSWLNRLADKRRKRPEGLEE